MVWQTYRKEKWTMSLTRNQFIRVLAGVLGAVPAILAGKTGDETPEPLEVRLSLDDREFLEATRRAERDICRAFRVPEEMVFEKAGPLKMDLVDVSEVHWVGWDMANASSSSIEVVYDRDTGKIVRIIDFPG